MNKELEKGKATGSLMHNKQLDGLRAFAVFLVILEHFLLRKFQDILNIFKFGYVGVTLFFVLSGFLIGSILLAQRETYNNVDWKKVKFILRQFYIRRSLRIFPIYYILLSILIIAGFPKEIYSVYVWCYSYLFNVYMVINDVSLYPLSIIWTLCCEEQFYLILPFILLLTPKKFQFHAILSMIIFGMIFRTSLYLLGFSYKQYSVLVFSSFDLFGLGVLLAYLIRSKLVPRVNILWSLIPILAFFYFGNSILNFPGKSFLFVSIPFFGLASFLIIASASTNGMSFFGKICELKPLVYFGKISYGVYLYHTFCLAIINTLIARWFADKEVPELLILVSAFVLTLIVSSASYYFLEIPINNLKKRFDY